MKLQLKKGRADNRVAKIYDSPEMPENEATFSIRNDGINNSES